MANIVQQFGNAVQKTCTKDPLKARRLLRIGYHAKNLQFKFAPGKLNSAARLAARSTTSAMVAPLDHPEEAVMVTLFTPCEMLHVIGMHPYCCEGLGCYPFRRLRGKSVHRLRRERRAAGNVLQLSQSVHRRGGKRAHAKAALHPLNNTGLRRQHADVSPLGRDHFRVPHLCSIFPTSKPKKACAMWLHSCAK